MAQQTINVGAAPNDGTGTPLRTAFQYTNSNFTELYTAVGPSGNNIVVPGNATISGDLTVRTSKLKVDATGVAIGATSATYLLDVRGTDTTNALIAGTTKGIRFVASASTSSITGVDNTGSGSYQPLSIGGSALDFSLSGSTAMTLNSTGLGVGGSPTSKLHVSNTGAATRITITDDTTNGRSGYIESNFSDALVIGTTSGVRAIRFSPDNKPYYQIATDGVQTWLDGIGGTRMTLNATGLGVGGSPTRKLSIVGSGATYANINSGDNTSLVGILLGGTSTPSAGQVIYDNTANSLAFFTSGASRLLIDSSGNVGIGVTPSYLLHTAVASGANRNIARFQVTGASNGLTITWNHATTKMIVNFSNLPTSSAGLASGDLWIDTAAGNTLKVA